MKRKNKISFVCQECGYDTPSWLGKCPECGAWNSLKEITVAPLPSGPSILASEDVKPRRLSEIAHEKTARLSSGFVEMDMVLGGGIVHGSAILLAGDPGVGKSTLLLQLCQNITQAPIKSGQEKDVLYISGEESAEQIKMRADRLLPKRQNGKKATEKNVSNLLVLSSNDVDRTITQIDAIRPAFIVVDSIQTMQSVNVAGLAGSVGQVRYAALHFIQIAKRLRIPLVLVGHVTKEGTVAGPMVLSHMVDTVLFLEGEKHQATRMLRSLKNRFGPVDEVGIFVMEGEGMKEVTDPEHLFSSGRPEDVPGSVLVATMEGTRAFLIELQALVVYSKLPMPRRVVSGVDVRRLELLLAVLQKHCRLPVETMDVFINVAGGMKLSDPAIDVGICLAVYSSLKNIPLPKTVACAEVGLLGELRVVSGLEKRIREAEKVGLKHIISAKHYKKLTDVLQALDTNVKK
ncbi:MAG: DNA repair protein RadA [Candidatus Levybacteria bacterium]|nr:DNA repair protein RadA [Candidatus Levybacteria bacterium]